LNNYKLTLSYDGTEYYGFQYQKNLVKTIEGELKKALFDTLHIRPKLIPAGRTDRGVHAEAQVVSMKVEDNLDPNIIYKAMNAVLPQNISVENVEKVTLDFHPRYSAKSRTYYYHFCTEKMPLMYQRYITYINYTLDFCSMDEIEKLFLGMHNFKNFKSMGSFQASDVKTIFDFKLIEKNVFDLYNTETLYKVYCLIVKANGFLYKMVRNIVGAIIEVLRGKRRFGELSEMLNNTNIKPFVIPTAPARGLSLVSVEY